MNRNHIVYLPTNYTTDMPLVLNLHGYTDIAHNQMIYISMNLVADANDFVLVYPFGSTDQNGDAIWNSGVTSEDVKDLGYLSALIDTLLVNYQLNTSRVYICGFSNGGFNVLLFSLCYV